MTIIETIKLLDDKGACSEARSWAKRNFFRDSARLWATCPRGDWMLWIEDYGQIKETSTATVFYFEMADEGKEKT